MNAPLPAVDPLSQLRDLHLPPDPSWFPPAPGWWAVAALALAALAILARQRLVARRRRAPFRAASIELAALRADADAGRATPIDFAHGANAILKRVAVHALRRPEAAPLTGDDWLAFLDRLGEGEAFRRGAGAALGDARFTTAAAIDHRALDACVRELLARLERPA